MIAKIVHYLEKLFGYLAIRKYELNLCNLPFYLGNEYQIFGIYIFNRRYACVFPKNVLNLKTYKIQKKKLEELLSLPIVLCIDNLSFQQRENLTINGIEFIEPNKQIFIPSIGIILNDRQKSISNKKIERFSPQIQLCVLFFLYKFGKEHTAKEICQVTGLNGMAVSRGVAALSNLNLLSVRKSARTKYYKTRVSKVEYLSAINHFLVSPVSRKFYARETDITNNGIKAGYTALSQITSITDDSIPTYAISKGEYKLMQNQLLEYSDEVVVSHKTVRIEVWKYSPTIYVNNGCVDKLSLYLSFERDIDERTEEALNELMKEIENG